jgi:hypothetical protein
MQRSTFLISAALIAGVAHVQAQGILDAISTPEKAVPVINQTLTGTWLSQLRRPDPTGLLLPPIPTLITFSSDGTIVAAPADVSQTATHGLWVRVGDRKFLATGFFFGFNESRVLATITKLRINFQVSADGKTLTGTTEAVVMDPDGKVIATLPGATNSAVRLYAEKPGDFDAFQTQ